MSTLAGCTGGDSGAGTETTAGGDTGSTTGTQSLDGYPPGTSESGIEEPTILYEATRTALRNNDYRLTTQLAVGGGSTVSQEVASSLRAERSRHTFTAASEQNVIYTADGTRYVKSTTAGETSYSERSVERAFREQHRSRDVVRMLDGAEMLGGIIRNGRYEPTETVSQVGRAAWQFDLRSPNPENVDGDVAESTGMVVVGADGVILKGELALNFEAGTSPDSLYNSFTIGALGAVDVERPTWVDEQF